jgi:hypothetical protein
MSQGASADDSKQSKRFQNPAYVYGPMVYQFPPEQEVEKEKPKSNQGVNFLVLVLIIILVVGGVILYLKENGIDIRQLSIRRAIMGQEIFRPAGENHLQPPPLVTQARVAVESLYLRDGPGVEYVATYLLPEDWDVSLLGDYQTDNYGEVWARVLVETEEGAQEGWVSRRFLD